MKCSTRTYGNRVAPAGFGWVADVDRLLNDIVGNVDATRTAQGFVPALDLTETESDYQLVFELPGVAAEDVNIEAKNDTLTVSGEKKRVSTSDEPKKHRLERSFGQFERSLKFPQAVDFDQADATFDQGLLHLVVPKSAKAMPRKIQIKSGSEAPPAASNKPKLDDAE